MNLMTEEEARARWCPFARVPLYAAQPVQEESPTAANRAPPGASDSTRAGVDRETRCLGGECMAWRWEPLASIVDSQRLLGEPIEPKRGSCGLAGRRA